MKMNLSVVMGMVDKMSKPLKGVSSETDHYAKAIKKLEQQQAKDSAALGMINRFKNLRQESKDGAISLAAANEKLDELKAKATAAGQPSAALTEKIAKQQARVNKLTTSQDQNNQSLVKMGRELQKTGVRVHDLDGESKRLNKSYDKHGKEIGKLSKRYSVLQKAMSPINKLNKTIRMPNIGAAAMGKGSALVGGLSIAGLVTEVSSSADEMDRLAKSARTLNMPIEELQAMQSQAGHAGVEASTMTTAMTRFTKRLGTLQKTGAGALGSFLKKSRNSVFGELETAANTQDAYEKLLDAFSNLKTEQEQMAFADAAFGQDGRKMLIMLREGTEGLTSARKALNDIGGGVTEEDAVRAEAYNDAMQKVQEAIQSIKFAALAPIMEKATTALSKFLDKFKNSDFRADFLEKATATVSGLYNRLTLLGKGLLWASQNFKGILAAIAIFKVALIGLNAVIMVNPIGMIVAAVGAAIIAIAYLVDKFVGLDKVINWVKEAVSGLWSGIKKLINMLPDALIPDGWKLSAKNASAEVENLAKSLDKVKDKNATLGITTNEQHNKEARTAHGYQTGGLTTKQSTYGAYQPLKGQMNKSKSEVSLTIKSDKPVTVDKANSDKHTDIDLDVGNMAWSY
ncbi:MAG: hypothetical protein AAGJ78_04835 [Pseudomonadota bacterium]